MSDLPPSLLIEIDPPIVAPDGKRVDAIELREPTVGEVMAAQKEAKDGNAESMMRMQVKLISEVSGQLRQVVEKMPIRKIMEASNYLMGFLDDSPSAGNT